MSGVFCLVLKVILVVKHQEGIMKEMSNEEVQTTFPGPGAWLHQANELEKDRDDDIEEVDADEEEE